MISSYSLYNGMAQPATVPEFYFQGRPVYRSVAADPNALNQPDWRINAQGIPSAGAAGATASQGMISPQTANIFSGLIQGLGNAAGSYVGAVPQQPTMPTMQPQLATLPLANLGERSIIRG